MLVPPKPRPGDRVSVISPSGGLPEVFPLPYELGLRRLREVFELEPVEYPTTRRLHSSAEERAADVMAAFADPSTTAVVASIGGDDQLKVLKHVDVDVLRAHPKPFFGLSDNTNMLNLLHTAGVVGYHGPTVMFGLGRGGRLHPDTEASLRAALFTTGTFELPEAGAYNDVDRDWADTTHLATEPEMRPGGGWRWHGASRSVTGRAWGGCLEIVDFNLRAGRYLRDVEHYAGMVLFLETSEELPDATYVERVLMCMGERGLLQQASAVLWGRPKAWAFERPLAEAERDDFAEAQYSAALNSITEYCGDIPVVLGVHIGHTDPLLTLPYGGPVTVDAAEQRLTVEY